MKHIRKVKMCLFYLTMNRFKYIIKSSNESFQILNGTAKWRIQNDIKR